jgi:hypothetical protein
MERINANPRIWRGIVLGLLLVALMGPWVFDQINVPAQYACSAPFIRLEGDFCGTPLSGLWILGAVGLSSLAGLLGGEVALSELGRAVLVLVVLGLPLISTVVLLLHGNRRRWIGFQLTTFVLTVSLLLWSGLLRDLNWALVFWGPWLYLGVAGGTLLLEGVRLVTRSRRNAIETK